MHTNLAMRIVGFLGLAALAVATYAITSYAVNAAQQARGQRAQLGGVEPVRITDVEARGGAGGLGAGQVVIPAWQYQSGTNRLRITGLAPNAGGIGVEAVAVLAKTTYDRPFVWSLAVYAERSREPIWEARYDHQTGVSPRGALLQPTFRGHIELPPGSYRVTVRIHEVPPNGMATLDNKKGTPAYAFASDSADITIP